VKLKDLRVVIFPPIVIRYASFGQENISGLWCGLSFEQISLLQQFICILQIDIAVAAVNVVFFMAVATFILTCGWPHCLLLSPALWSPVSGETSCQ
jgi:hypothetical protein